MHTLIYFLEEICFLYFFVLQLITLRKKIVLYSLSIHRLFIIYIFIFLNITIRIYENQILN